MALDRWTPRSASRFSSSRSRQWHVTGKLLSLRTARHLADIDGLTTITLPKKLHRLAKPVIAPKPLATSNSGKDEPLTLEDPITHEATMNVSDKMFYFTPTEAATPPSKPMFSHRPTPTSPPRPVNPLLHNSTVTVSLSKRGTLSLQTPSSHTLLPPPQLTNGLMHTSWTHSRPRHKTFGGSVEHWQCALGRGWPWDAGWWEWVGVGRCPTWVGGGDCVTVLKGRPVRGDVHGDVKKWTAQWRRVVRSGEAAKRRKVFGIF